MGYALYTWTAVPDSPSRISDNLVDNKASFNSQSMNIVEEKTKESYNKSNELPIHKGGDEEDKSAAASEEESEDESHTGYRGR